MFKLVCENCGKESKIENYNNFIDTAENITIAVGDYELDYIRCDGCKNTLFANEEIKKSVTESDL